MCSINIDHFGRREPEFKLVVTYNCNVEVLQLKSPNAIDSDMCSKLQRRTSAIIKLKRLAVTGLLEMQSCPHLTSGS